MQRKLANLLAEQPTAADLALAQMIGTSAASTGIQAPNTKISDILAATKQAELDAEAIDMTRLPKRYSEFLDGKTAKGAIDAVAKKLQISLDETKQFITEAGTKFIDSASTPVGPDTSQEIAFGKKVGSAFKTKVIEICTRLGCDPNHLMAAMAFETGETFSPSKRSPVSSATGLIQFLESTATGLGTSTTALASMSAIEQLDFVEKYLKPFRGRMKSLSDVYMAIFAPVGVGELESFVLYTSPSKAYKANEPLDANKDGRITKGEAATKVQHKLQRGLGAGLVG